MKNFLIAFLVFLVWSVFGLYLYSFASTSSMDKVENKREVSEIKTLEPEVVDKVIDTTTEIIPEEPLAVKKNFVIRSLDQEVLFESDASIIIEKDVAAVKLPEELLDLPSRLASYLLEHPGQELHITSYYSPSAKLQTPNIGEQRGVNFKKMLISAGADENQIVIKPAISKTDFDENNTLENGIAFSFKMLDRERIANKKTKIPDGIRFYPNYNFDELLADNKLQKLTDSVASIMDQNPNLKIIITGHTNHIGADSENYQRGLKSARQIRWYFVNRGRMERKNVIAISKGETEPILRDGKPASRKENERIEIKFTEKE